MWAFPEAHAHLERALSALDRIPAGAVAARPIAFALLEQAADVAYMAGAGAAFGGPVPSGDRRQRRGRPTRRARRARYAMLGRNAWAVGRLRGRHSTPIAKAIALLPADPPSVELARVLAEEAAG